MAGDYGNSSIVKYPTFWERRTTLEKALLTICILLAVGIIALVATLCMTLPADENSQVGKPTKVIAQALTGNKPSSELKKTKNTNDDDEKSPLKNVCLTRGCINAASRVFEAIDETVNPCDDFYNFACGNFVKNTFIPDDKITVDTFAIVSDKLQEQLRTIINEESLPNEAKPFTLAKKLNKACLNKTIIEQRGNQPLKDMLESLGGWPAIKGDQWSEDQWDWVNKIKEFRKIGIDTSYIFTFTVGINLKNSTSRIIDIDQPDLGLDREYIKRGINDKVVKAYYDFIVNIAVILGADKAKAEKEILESLEFETALANITWPKEERRNGTVLYNPFTIKEVQEKYPYLHWLDYINALLPKGLSVDENEVIIVSVPSFFEKLGDLLQNTPKRTLANYLIWRAALFSTGFLTNQLRQEKLAYYAAFSGQQDQEPRWKECIGYTTSSLPISVGALYVRKYFNQESKSTAVQMVEGIRNEFLNILHNLSWMDEETRNAAIEKAKALTRHIGYPDELADNNKLEEFYKNLDLEPDNLYFNGLRLNVFQTDYIYNKLRKPVNKTDWETHSRPAVVNALYSAVENSIQFPAGILQDKFFSAERPRYMNYAAIGSIIGHEITHGFDDQGRQFDLNGNLVEWWQSDTKTHFLEKAKCIIEQYGNYTDKATNLQLNGINTQGENIADNGGLKESYNAYKQWVKTNGPEPTLPGLNYKPEQLFWISAAQTWCAVSRDEYTKLKITTGYHSPNQFRVLGPVSNMKEFSADFNCPLGSPMNPVKKCEVW